MELTINGFRKFLVDEIKRKSNASYSDAFDQVNQFCKTDEFNNAFEKWKVLTKRNKKRLPMPKSMKTILCGIFEKEKV